MFLLCLEANIIYDIVILKRNFSVGAVTMTREFLLKRTQKAFHYGEKDEIRVFLKVNEQ